MPKTEKRFTRAEAARKIKPIVEMLEKGGFKYEICGSWRRGKENVGDIDILVEKGSGKYLDLSGLNIDWAGEEKIGFEIESMHVDIKFVPKESWGAGLLHHTGPYGFNIKLRSMAKKKGWLLNEYGLFDRKTGKVIASRTEREVLEALMNKESAEKLLDPRNRKTPDWVKKYWGVK